MFYALLLNKRMLQIRAYFSKLLLPVSSKISSKKDILTTKDFEYQFLSFQISFLLHHYRDY